MCGQRFFSVLSRTHRYDVNGVRDRFCLLNYTVKNVTRDSGCISCEMEEVCDKCCKNCSRMIKVMKLVARSHPHLTAAVRGGKSEQSSYKRCTPGYFWENTGTYLIFFELVMVRSKIVEFAAVLESV